MCLGKIRTQFDISWCRFYIEQNIEETFVLDQFNPSGINLKSLTLQVLTLNFFVLFVSFPLILSFSFIYVIHFIALMVIFFYLFLYLQNYFFHCPAKNLNWWFTIHTHSTLWYVFSYESQFWLNLTLFFIHVSNLYCLL